MYHWGEGTRDQGARRQETEKTPKLHLNSFYLQLT